MDNPNLGFTQRLDDQLKSCRMPEHDPLVATTDELIRDLHRVVTGNGRFNQGLIYKVASANANLDELKESVVDVRSGLTAQVKKCEDIQNARAVAQAGKTTISKIGRAIWDNKALIFVIVLAAIAYFVNLNGRIGTAAAEDKILKAVDARIDKLLAGAALPALQNKKTP